MFWLFSILLSKTSTWRLAMIITPVPAGTLGHGVALGGEVVVIVFDDLVVVDAAVMADFLWQVGQREDQDAAGVVGGHVFVDVGVDRVFDFDAGHVVLGPVAAHDDVLRLADVDAGVRGVAGDAIFDQHVLAQHRIQAVAAVGFLGSAGPTGADFAKRDAVAAVDLDRVALGVFDGQVLDREILPCWSRECLRRRCLALLVEGQNRLVLALAANRDVADVERQRGGELELAFAEFDHVARLGVDQRGLSPLLGVGAGLDLRDRLRGRRTLGLHAARRNERDANDTRKSESQDLHGQSPLEMIRLKSS